MKTKLLCGIACFFYSVTSVSAQQQFPNGSEALFNKAMKEINPKYTTWIRSTAQQVNEKNLGEAEVKQMTSTKWAVLGAMNGQDIEAIAFLVLMQAAKSAQEDLKSIMAKVKSINDQKERLRTAVSVLNDKNQNITRARLDSIKLLSAQTSAIQKRNNPEKTQPAKASAKDSPRPNGGTLTVSRSEIDTVKDQIKNQLDSKSELGETESLRLQMAMDRMSKMMSTLSNLLKKISDTGQSITQNLK